MSQDSSFVFLVFFVVKKTTKGTKNTNRLQKDFKSQPRVTSPLNGAGSWKKPGLYGFQTQV